MIQPIATAYGGYSMPFSDNGLAGMMMVAMMITFRARELAWEISEN